MTINERRIRFRFWLPAVLATASAGSCVPGLLPGFPQAATTAFRIENATTSTIDVSIEVLDAAGQIVTITPARAIDIPVITITADSVSYSTLQPIGAAAARAAETGGSIDGTIAEGRGGQADVRVPGRSMSEGYLLCGTTVRIQATVAAATGSDETAAGAAVTFTGDGAGTPGFDQGSVGAEGERFLVAGVDFACGESIVVRIDSDGKATGAAPMGRLAVVPAGAPSPFDALDTGGAGGDGGGGGGDTDTNGAGPEPTPDVTFVVNNLTHEFLRINILAGADGADGQKDVFLPETGSSAGSMTCAQSYTIKALSLVPEALTGLLDEVLIVLQGDGTGTPSFDSGSVGQFGQRLLEINDHFACGGTITVTITDPGQPGFTEPDVLDDTGTVIGFQDINSNGIQDEVPDRLGAGTVDVD